MIYENINKKILNLFNVPNFDIIFMNIPEQAKKDFVKAIIKEIEQYINKGK